MRRRVPDGPFIAAIKFDTHDKEASDAFGRAFLAASERDPREARLIGLIGINRPDRQRNVVRRVRQANDENRLILYRGRLRQGDQHKRTAEPYIFGQRRGRSTDQHCVVVNGRPCSVAR